jgi:predicted metal-dependent HD superfamily phosphohydrolase
MDDDPLLQQRLSVHLPATVLGRLRERYAEPHRHYHTWSHILACLDAKDQLTDAVVPEVDLALLFHDAVYDPRAGSGENEERSAELLLEEGRRAWLDDAMLRRAQALVRATAHGLAAAPADEEDDAVQACVVLDADLSILGADPATFDAYETAIRQEYAAVDDAAFAAGRAHVLRAFLARPLIYRTRRGQRLWEAGARSNLERSLARWG